MVSIFSVFLSYSYDSHGFPIREIHRWSRVFAGEMSKGCPTRRFGEGGLPAFQNDHLRNFLYDRSFSH